MFLKSYTPNKLVEELIQYDYKGLHLKFNEVARNKMIGRQNGSPQDPTLLCKVDFDYNRIDLDDVPLKWVKIWNMMYFRHKDQQAAKRLKKALGELGILRVKEFMYRFLVSYTKQADLIVIDKIYNILLSTLL